MSEEKCLRNMNCKCKLCVGEDIAMLQSISRSIKSTVKYEGDKDEEMTGRGSVELPHIPSNILNSRKTEQVQIPHVQKANSTNNDKISSQCMPPAAIIAHNTNINPDQGSNEATAPANEANIDTIILQMTDKNWKTRKAAYEQVQILCDRHMKTLDAMETNSLLAHFKSMCQDSNISALDSGILAVTSYVCNVTPMQKSLVPGIMKGIIEKGFSSRPSTVTLCGTLIMCLIESGACEDVIEALIAGTEHKKPKVPPACTSCILEALKSFGPCVVRIQMLKAALPKMCESTINLVRQTALQLLIEIHRWAGPAVIQDIISNLRQAQQTEYEANTKDIVPGQAVPTKFIRGEEPNVGSSNSMAKAGSKGPSVSHISQVQKAIDPREFVDTINLPEKLAKTEFRTKLAQTKWTEKVAALKIVLDTIGPVPKLANGDFGELVSILKKLAHDSNVNIVAKTFEVVAALANGLRKQFGHYARIFVPILTNKLSDKKSVVLHASNLALDAIQKHVIPLEQLMEDIRSGVNPAKTKAPQARVQMIEFVSRSLVETQEQNNIKHVQLVAPEQASTLAEFAQILCQAMEDVDPSVRKIAVEAFVKIYHASEKTVARSGLQQQLEKTSRSNSRIYKSIETNLADYKSASSANESVHEPSSSSLKEKSGVSSSSSIATKRKSVSGSRAAAPVSGNGSRSNPHSATSAGKAAASPAATNTNALSISEEEAESIIAELLPETWANIMADFSSVKWLNRKNAIEGLHAIGRDNHNHLSKKVLEAIALVLAKQTKDFKDSNVNVLKSAFGTLGDIASRSNRFPHNVIRLVLPPAVDKCSDRKLSQTVHAMIVEFCEATHPEWVLECLLAHLPSVRTPLVHIEIANTICVLVKEFGVSNCGPRNLVDYVKGPQALESSSAKCRSAAIGLLGKMYSQIGPAMLPILQLDTWKPALVVLVEKEFAVTGYDASSALSSISRKARGTHKGKELDDEENHASRSTGKQDEEMPSLFGRQDISSLITKELMANMKCEDDKAAWKKRSAALDSVQSMCEHAGYAIELTKPVVELMRALKPRLADSNANLKVRAAQIVGVLATSIGPDVSKLTKIIGAALLNGCSDNKKNMQVASLEALQKYVVHQERTSLACMESFLTAFADQLSNPVGRAELLAWAAENLKNCAEQQPQQKLDLSILVAPTIQCLMDRSTCTREKAQSLLVEVLRSVGQNAVLAIGCRDMKPAQIRTLKPIILKAIESLRASSEMVSRANTLAKESNSNPEHTNAIHINSERLESADSIRASQKLMDGVAMDTSADLDRSFQRNIGSISTLPLITSDDSQKSHRLYKIKQNPWTFDASFNFTTRARISELESDLRPFCSNDFADNLFAIASEEVLINASTVLYNCVLQQPEQVVSLLDLLLKWITLRLVDSNVQILAKALEILSAIFATLQQRTYQLYDAEADILLPYLLNESGHSKPRFRIRYRELLRQASSIISKDGYLRHLTNSIVSTTNDRSRCECIDMTEYLLAHGWHTSSCWKNLIREIVKFISAQDREVRECALRAIIAAYKHTDGGLEFFFQSYSMQSQRDIELITDRIRQLQWTTQEPSSKPDNLKAFQEEPYQDNSSRLGPDSTLPQSSIAKLFGRKPSPVTKPLSMNDDVVMHSPTRKCPTVESFESGGDPATLELSATDKQEVAQSDMTMEFILLDPLSKLANEQHVLTEREDDTRDGLDAMKALYAIATCPADSSEINFLSRNVDTIVLRLCDCIQASFRSVKQPTMLEKSTSVDIHMQLLSLSITTLRAILKNHDTADHLHRYTIERILLVGSTTLQHPCLQNGSPALIQNPEKELDTPEKKRHYVIIRAVYKIILDVLEQLKIGEVYPSIINLLQRIVRNDVSSLNGHEISNPPISKDSLDQLLGRILVHVSKQQADAIVPFDGLDFFGVLMQMHCFFATLPQCDMFATHSIDKRMQAALYILASSFMKENASMFEASVDDLPADSPIRTLLIQKGFLKKKQSVLAEPIASSFGSKIDPFLHKSDQNMQFLAETQGSRSDLRPVVMESIQRRLFDNAPFSSSSDSTTRSSMNMTASLPSSQTSSTSTMATTRLIRERLDRVRKF